MSYQYPNIRKALQLVVSVAVSELAGIIGAAFTAPSIPTWYAGLVKPALNPPAWIFGPVWTTLYALMGTSLFLIWSSYAKASEGLGKTKIVRASWMFFIQLALTIFWSIFFFGMQNPALAFADIILLWLAILTTIILFYRISKPASYLLLPYILWVSFAVYLNYSLWMLN
ncbi:MAG: tryptophan-rich sensory protein [Candidatus Taylorbacteria bacterium]|nr:tryptophan-rich sensory protein [Candidatus Taylorbacteria bacterium]